MKLEVFEKNTRTRVDIIRVYNYVFYEDELNGVGKFEVRMPAKDHSLSWLYNYGNWILFDDGILGIIKGIKDVEDDDTEISVYGYLSNHILEFRSFLLTAVYHDTPPKIAFSMFDGLYVHPEDERRKIGFLRASTDLPGWSDKIRYQVTGKTLLDTLQEMLTPYDLGFELYPVIKNYNQQSAQYANVDGFEFRIIKPVDRTIDNPYGNVPVVFSFENNNLQQLEYEEDGQTFASVAIVASEGVGQDRVTLEVQNTETEYTGYERIELYVDARDLQSEQEPEPEPPEPEPPEPQRFTKIEYLKNNTLTSKSLGVALSSFHYGIKDEGNRKAEVEFQCDYATHAQNFTSSILYFRYVNDNEKICQYTFSTPYGSYGEVTEFNVMRVNYADNNLGYGVNEQYEVPDYNQKRKLTISLMDSKFAIDDSERDFSSMYQDRQKTDSTEFNLYLGSSGTVTYYYTKCRYYSVKVYDQNGTMVNHFYPVLENDTNKIGMYDIVNDNFVEFDSSIWETGPILQEETQTTTETESEQSSNEIDEKLREMMIERGKEKLESCQKFITFDASIIEGKYIYGKDFYKGDYVSVVDKNTNRVYNVQVTSVKKTYSNGVEHRDITLGTDRMKIKKLQNKRLLTLLNSQGG